MNVPKIRFSNFSDDYIIKDVSEITSNISSGKISKQLEDGEYNVYGSMGIIGKSNFYDYTGEKVLVARVGANAGSVNKINENCCISDNTLVLEPKDILNDYLYYSLSHYNPKKLIFGSGQPLVTGGQLKKVQLGIPCKEEQAKVSNFLSLLDKKIELQSKKIEDLKLFKLYTENNLLNSDDSINWKETKLSDILIEGNKTPVKNTNDFKKITIKLNLNGLEFNETKREMSDTRPFYVREENEIIIGKQNYFNGSIAIVTKEFAGCICSNAIMSFKVKEEFDLDYIYLYLSQKKYMKQREFLANGTGQKELSEKEFLKFTIKIPDDSTIKKIISTINRINKKINLENNKLNKLMKLKKGLMQNMFV